MRRRAKKQRARQFVQAMSKMMSDTTETCFNETEAEERQYLGQVIGKISSELIAYSDKVDARQDESREMVTDLNDQRDEMDHAEKANMRESVNLMRQVTDHSVKQQQRLSKLIDSPYFGRIDITSPESGQPHPVYIGIHSFYDAETEAQLIHDWRAPIASMFYEYELGDASYEAPRGQIDCEILRKRQYRIERQRLQFMLDTSVSIQDEILQEELSRASDEQMKNIVATIQRDQNAIIRNDEAHTLIIQGAAGSGKTSIALHRIAFLLYRYKESIRSDDILIISPNRVFAHYISQVLPELGEEMIQQTTMEELVVKLLGPQVKFQSFAQQVAMLLDRRNEKYAERVQFKATTDFLKQLDAYIQHIRETNFQPADIKVGLYTVRADWLASRFSQYRTLPINEQLTKLTDDVAAHIQDRYSKRITGKERDALRSAIKAMFSFTTLKALYKHFYTWLDKPEMFKQLKGGQYEYADVFPLLYLQKLVERPPATSRIKHVVIDEMQDYTPVQYQVLSNLYPCQKTILGDHNQSVSPLSSSSAEGIGQILHQAQCMYMNKSYRSTLQITELAQTIHHNPNLVPIERHGETPTLITCDDADQELEQIRQIIRDFRDSDHNSLGIICKNDEQAHWLHAALGDAEGPIHLLDAQSTAFGNGVMIATAYLTKGLEFDQVIVPLCNTEHYHTPIDRHMLYVACTRAMHKLDLTHTGKPSELLHPALENEALLTKPAKLSI